MKIKKDSTGIIILIAIISYFVILMLFIFGILHFNNKLIEIATSNQVQYTELAKELNSKRVSTKKIQLIEANNNKNYQDFLIQYHSTQSDWLNAWLFALTIVLAIMGIILPILNMNIFASKKEEIDKIIKEGKITNKRTQLTIDKIKKEVDDSQSKVANDLQEVKDYVEKAKESERKTEANNYYSIANKDYDEKDYEKAIENYEKAIELYPQFAEAYCSRGNAFANLKQEDKALADYKKAIELNPKMAVAHCNIGNIFTRLKQYEEAMESYNMAILNKPNFVNAYINRALIWRNWKQYEKALDDCNKAIQLNPKSSLGFSGKGCTFTKLGSFKEAITEYKKAIELDKNNLSALYNLCEALIFSNCFNEAFEYLKIYVHDKAEPDIWDDDYDAWMKVLNEHLGEGSVQEIMQIIDEKLKKKSRD